MYDVVITNELAIIHQRGCGDAVRFVVEHRFFYEESAEIWTVEELGVRDTIMSMAGMDSGLRITWCEECFEVEPEINYESIPESKLSSHINGSGARIVIKNGVRFVECWKCGGLVKVNCVVCDHCRDDVWKPLKVRLHGWNKKIKEGIKKKDAVVVAHTIHLISEVLESMPGSRFEQDGAGFAVEIKKGRNAVVVEPEVTDDEFDIPLAPADHDPFIPNLLAAGKNRH
jgi:hypothetical protein